MHFCYNVCDCVCVQCVGWGGGGVINWSLLLARYLLNPKVKLLKESLYGYQNIVC